ncbi:MAG: SDR family NAD(P)-dependent oxidoreductase [Actinomycetota bacterium]
MQLDGAVALVTGAGSGIGRALAVELSVRGAVPILLGRNLAALEETRSLLASPAAGRVLALDLADEQARAGIARRVAELSDRLDLLVNNAGVVEAGPLDGQPEAAWRQMVEVNLLAPMSVTRALLPMLQASGRGRVVNVGSMFGDIGFPFFAAYSATKFGLRGWSDALRREVADSGVTVTYCAPRGTRTAAADGFARYVDVFAMRLDPADLVARRIADGIASGARDIYPRGPERLFVLVQRLFPRLVDQALRDQTRKAAGRVRMVSGS